MSLHLTTKVVKSSDGTDILAEATGNSSKQSIVFAHGLACSGAHFDSLFAIPELLENFYLVRYDQRGQGRSGKPTAPEAYASERYSDDFKAVSEAFGVTKPIFAGWSAGAPIAADLLHSGVPLAGIIWISAIPYLGDIMGSILPPPVAGMLPILCSGDNPALLEGARAKFCSAFVAPSRVAPVPATVTTAWVEATTQMPPECAALLIPRKQDPTRLFEEIKKLPVCIIHGKEDLIVLSDKLVEGIEAKLNNPEIHLLDNVGHIPFWEEPQKVADIIVAFSKQI